MNDEYGAKRPRRPPLGELLSVSEAEGVRYENIGALQNTHDAPSATR